jgi:hypothetical protein
MTTTVAAAPQATPASGDQETRQQVLVETKPPYVAFLTPEIVSYFIGVLAFFWCSWRVYLGGSISGRMCRRCFADGR